MTEVIQITYEVAVASFEKPASKEGMAGWSKRAIYYAVIVEGVYAAVSSIQHWSTKAKFNNHYVFPEYRGRGLFKLMFDFLIVQAQNSSAKYIEATCTPMSIRHYLQNGFEVVKNYRVHTAVRKDL